MSTGVVVARDFAHVADLAEAVAASVEVDGFDYVTVPLVHPLHERDQRSALPDRGVALTRTDTILASTEWYFTIIFSHFNIERRAEGRRMETERSSEWQRSSSQVDLVLPFHLSSPPVKYSPLHIFNNTICIICYILQILSLKKKTTGIRGRGQAVSPPFPPPPPPPWWVSLGTEQFDSFVFYHLSLNRHSRVVGKFSPWLNFDSAVESVRFNARSVPPLPPLPPLPPPLLLPLLPSCSLLLPLAIEVMSSSLGIQTRARVGESLGSHCGALVSAIVELR